MKNIKVLGTGCARCKATVELINDVAEKHNIEITLEKVEDLPSIMAYEIMSTPGVVINEKVVHTGGIPSQEQIEAWLKE
jgi:small redox-active disulfide protein 2